MPDPRVIEVTYTLELPEGRTVANSRPWSSTFGDFDVNLDDRELRVRPRGKYYSVEAVRLAFEPFLRSMEAQEDLIQNLVLAFRPSGGRFEAHIGESGAVMHHVEMTAHSTATARISVVAEYNPGAISPQFTDTIQVRLLRTRWRDAIEGRAPLLAEAEFVLTSLRGRFGGTRLLPGGLSVATEVLNTLGHLGERQDDRMGRKVKRGEAALSDLEVTWIKAVVPRLIHRLGEIEGGASNPALITMSDFPLLH